MRILLNFQDLGTYAFDVQPTSTILTLKERISTLIEIPTHQFWFTCMVITTDLTDDQTFENAGIQEGQELYVEGQ